MNRCGDIEKAIEVFNDIKRIGKHHNTILYTTLMKGYGRPLHDSHEGFSQVTFSHAKTSPTISLHESITTTQSSTRLS